MLYRIGALGTVTAAPGAREALGVARAVRVLPTSFAAPARSAAARVEPLLVTPPPRPVVVAVPRPVAPSPVVVAVPHPPPPRDPVAEAAAYFAAHPAVPPGSSPLERVRPVVAPRSPVERAPVRPATEPSSRPLAEPANVPSFGGGGGGGLFAEPVDDTRAPSPAPELVKAPVSASIDIPGELWIGAGIFAAAVVLGGIYLATRHLSPKRAAR